MLTEKALFSKIIVDQKGPLETLLPCSPSKILDFLSIHKDWDYSVSDIAKGSNLSFKTTLSGIKHLEQQGAIRKTRVVGKAILYELNSKSELGYSIENLIFRIAKKNASNYSINGDKMKPTFTERLETVLNGLQEESEFLEEENKK